MAEQGIINTFSKGINQDISFISQPDGTYRNMKNGMLISYDGNHYSVEMTKGNKVLLTLVPRYLTTVAALDIEPMPIGFISFIDKLVVFSTNSESTTGYGEIGVITFTRVNLDFVGTYVPYYHHASLNFTKLHKIEGFSFRENDNIERVYWTDNFNEPRVFDIANPIFTTYIPAFPSLLPVGSTYMVLNGAVLHGGVIYGPGLTAGNIFTTTVSAISYIVWNGTPKVIEYYPVSLLDWSPSRLLGNMTFQEYGVGSKNCGDSIYFYRLSRASDGFQTSWSYASNPIHIGMTNQFSAVIPGVNSYHDFSGNGSSTTLENSGKSIKIKISNIDTDFDTIELACAEFNQVSEIPYRIVITNKEVITSSEITIEDKGLAGLGTVTISDITLFPASILKCKTITTNKNYNIIANITEREEFELDLSGVTLSSFQYPIIAHGDLDICTNNITYDPHSPPIGINPVATSILPWSRYLVTNISGGDITYNAVTYTLGQVFVGVVGQTSATIPVGSQCRPCATRNRYTQINGAKRVEDAIELKTAFWDYKDPTVASHNRGYWSNEKYRLAILFFDLKGNPFYAKYINDIVMPDIYTKSGLIRSDAYVVGSETEIYSLNPSGIKVSGIDIPKSIVGQISGFSIVRAERDVRIVTQGLVMQTYQGVGPCRPTGSLNGIFSYGGAVRDYLTYTCPDYLDNNPMKKQFGASGDFMEEATFLGAYAYGGGADIKSDINDNNAVSKLFTPLISDTSSLRKNEIAVIDGNYLTPFSEGEGKVLDSGSIAFDNTVYTNPIIGPLADLACAGGGSTFLTDRRSTGNKKLVFKLKTMFTEYGSVTQPYNDTSTTEKILMNYVKNISPSNQYGGIGESAIANTLYMSTGHFQPITPQVIIDNNDTNNVNTYTKLTFNNIEVFGGDCFVNLIDSTYGLCNSALTGPDFAWTIYFPCECNSNYNLRRGRTPSRVGVFPGHLNGLAFDNGGASSPSFKLEDYSYNSGYSTEGTFIKYPALPLNYKFTGKFEYRERWAGLKYPGELIDSFRVFRLPDYRDLDGQRGPINNLKARDSKLFYWQDHGVGYTPILERQLVGGNALGDATALGVTGVIDRYDDIDTFFGNQHQGSLVETEYGFAWFDMRRRAFMVMGIGSKPEEMSMVKGLQVFFNGEFNEGNVSFPTATSTIYNTNNLDIPEEPLMGYGIVGCYDPTFKMTYLTFKYNKYDSNAGVNSLVMRDFTLGYNHILNAFVSFTDNCPAIWHNHNDLVLTANNPKNTKAYNAAMASTSFVVSDTVKVANVEYICIKDVVIASYPGTLTAITGTNPLAPSSNSWVAINKTNEIYLQNFGAELCKFFGKVWSHDMEIVVNFKTDEAVTPEFIKFKGLGANWTGLTAATTDQTASDLNISTTSRNYRYKDKAWDSSLPLPPNGRLTDYYVKLSFTFKNYVTDPRTAKNVQRVLQWLKTFFITKK